MKLGKLVVGGGLLCAFSAHAGGLFVPGSGAISASRAGAAVASTDDGEALSINPAGLAKAPGLKLTISLTFIRYYMSFTRRGTYDNLEHIAPEGPFPYEGNAYQTVENDPKPPLGIGTFQPLPVIVVTSDLGGRVKGLTIGGGLYTPSGYPFRDMTEGYTLQTDAAGDFSGAPPATRYDTMIAESALLLPSVAAAYRITPDIDVGARFTVGNLKAKNQVMVWGTPNNWEEDVRKDALFTAEVKDGFIPAAGIGATYRPTKNIELGLNWTSPVVVKAKGTASSLRGPGNDLTRQIGPLPDAMSKCETGGNFGPDGMVGTTDDVQKACISLQLPMTATVGGRYKMLDENDKLLGDVELDVNWENWGKQCDYSADSIVDSDCTSPGQFRVQVDSGLYTGGTFTGQTLNVNQVNLGLRDTFGLRLGGSYKIPMDAKSVVVRGGVAYDTAAAKDGWIRASFDGASRVTGALGGAYEAGSWQVSAGFAYVHEGTSTNDGANPDGSDCNPTPQMPAGCGAAGGLRPPSDRLSPTNPLIDADSQADSPYNQGSIKSHYIMFMTGFSKSW